jgi:hypothetical protein
LLCPDGGHRWPWPASGLTLLRHASTKAASFVSIDITGADYARDFSCRTTTASCAASRTSPARWWWCFSATPSARTCARRRCRAGRGPQVAGQGRRNCRAFCHGGPGARHAGGAQGLHGELRPVLPGLAPDVARAALRWPRTSRSITRRSMAARPPATPWTIRPEAMSTTPRASCACSRVMAWGQSPWPATSGNCSSRRPERRRR